MLRLFFIVSIFFISACSLNKSNITNQYIIIEKSKINIITNDKYIESKLNSINDKEGTNINILFEEKTKINNEYTEYKKNNYIENNKKIKCLKNEHTTKTKVETIFQKNIYHMTKIDIVCNGNKSIDNLKDELIKHIYFDIKGYHFGFYGELKYYDLYGESEESEEARYIYHLIKNKKYYNACNIIKNTKKEHFFHKENLAVCNKLYSLSI